MSVYQAVFATFLLLGNRLDDVRAVPVLEFSPSLLPEQQLLCPSIPYIVTCRAAGSGLSWQVRVGGVVTHSVTFNTANSVGDSILIDMFNFTVVNITNGFTSSVAFSNTQSIAVDDVRCIDAGDDMIEAIQLDVYDMIPDDSDANSTTGIGMDGMVLFDVNSNELPCTAGYDIIMKVVAANSNQTVVIPLPTHHGNISVEVVGIRAQGVGGLNGGIAPVAGTFALPFPEPAAILESSTANVVQPPVETIPSPVETARSPVETTHSPVETNTSEEDFPRGLFLGGWIIAGVLLIAVIVLAIALCWKCKSKAVTPGKPRDSVMLDTAQCEQKLSSSNL